MEKEIEKMKRQIEWLKFFVALLVVAVYIMGFFIYYMNKDLNSIRSVFESFNNLYDSLFSQISY